MKVEGSRTYSVLMSTYAKDNPDYLRLAIDSMLAQSIVPAEFVLVCDGPLPVDLNAVVCEYEAAYPAMFRIVRLPENVGLGNALAIGLANCTHPIVSRMDSDDISRPDRCEVLMHELQEKGLSVVGGAIAEFDSMPGDMASIRRMPAEWADARRFAKSRNPLNHMSVMFVRDDVLSVGGYQDFHYMEDYFLWVRMLDAGYRLGNVNQVVVDVRVGSGMYARRSNWKYLKSQFSFFTYLKQIGFVSSWECWVSKAVRFCSTVVPSSFVKTLYTSLLRSKA